MTEAEGDGKPVEERTPELRELQEELKALRSRAGLTLRKLAKKAKYSPAALSRATTNPKRPTWPLVQAFVRECGGSEKKFEGLWEAAGTANDDLVPPDQVDPREELIDSSDERDKPEGPRGTGPTVGSDEAPKRAWVRAALVIAVVTVIGLLLGLVAVLAPDRSASDGCLAPTVRMTANTPTGTVTQCVGRVVDPKSVPPEFNMEQVLGLIGQQNAKAEAAPNTTVSVAYILTVPRAPSGLSTKLRDELEGVQLAQKRANDLANLGGDQPQIRVVVYNTGEDNMFWSAAMSEIDALEQSGSPILAAIGLGQSRLGTLQLVDQLTRRLIPAITTRASADVLTLPPTDGGPAPAPPFGLFRLTPLNSELVAAAVAQLPEDSRVALLQDSSEDPYNEGLAQAFEAKLATTQTGVELVPVSPYDSRQNGVGTAFNNDIVPQLCRNKVDAVFVAGRGIDIERFLIALDDEELCPDRVEPIIVYTGDDGVDVLGQIRRANSKTLPDRQDRDSLNAELLAAFKDGDFIFRYAAPTHPGLWDTPEFQGTRAFNDSLMSFEEKRRKKDPVLDESSMMMGYDSMVTAVECTRRAAARKKNDLDVASSEVAGACTRFSPDSPIYGVSGRISFDEAGVVIDKTVPVVEVGANGGTRIFGLYPRR